MKVCIQQEDFDLNAQCQAIRERQEKLGFQIGALTSFVGLVRGDQGSDLNGYALELEHYPGMTEKVIAQMVQQAIDRFDLLDATVIHRVGRLEPGSQIVLVISASSHRRAAFQGCEFMMDYLKTQAPFWKKEHGMGQTSWVDAKVCDDEALKRWGIASGNASK